MVAVMVVKLAVMLELTPVALTVVQSEMKMVELLVQIMAVQRESLMVDHWAGNLVHQLA